MRSAVPLSGVVRLRAAAVPPHCDAVPEVWFFGGLLRLEAHENGPGPGGRGMRLLSVGAPVLLRASWLVLQWVLGMFCVLI